MDDSLEDILFRNNTFHVLDQLESLLDIVILKVIDDKVKSSFRDNINQWWKSL